MEEEKSEIVIPTRESARATTIAFQDEAFHRHASPHRRDGNRSQRRRRSSSRESISSVRSRMQSANFELPIQYRTLSFQASESRALSDHDLDYNAKLVGVKKDTLQTAADELARADEHQVDLQTLFQRLRVSPQSGLSSEAAAKRLQENGYNTLPKRRQNYAKKLAGYIFGGFCSILWVGVIIFFICWRPLGDPNPQPYNLGLAVLVMIVIFLQASFGAFQDWSTAKTLNSILDMVPSDAVVLRDGNYSKVPTKDLVVGDIVHLDIGDKIPADLRLMETSGDTRFDRAAMTGESEEVEASTDCTDENFLDSANVALMGTVVTNGSATGVVVFTGAKTVMGAIAKATSSVKEKPTSIQREISRFVSIIVGLTVCLACLILFAWVGWLRVQHKGYMSVVAMLNNVMGCVVAFIPEGMPVGVALTLMMIARRMKTANVLPKSLATVETLGCVQVICSDKTGTLTKNQMSVTTVGFADGSMAVESATEQLSRGRPQDAGALTHLARAARLCNAATFDPLTLDKPIADRLTQGNPSDGALLRFAEAATFTEAVNKEYPQVAAIPFNSKNKFMLTLHQTSRGSNDSEKLKPSEPTYMALMKGAPDVLLPRCSKYWSVKNNSVMELDMEARNALSDLQNELARQAQRVLLLCEREYKPVHPLNSNEFSQELLDTCAASEFIAVGVLGIFDPPRPETASTVATCRRAGIRVFMMTGDFGLTGVAIARQVGIFTGEAEPHTWSTIKERRGARDQDSDDGYSNHSLLLEGSQIGLLEDVDWDLVCEYEAIVFGRCAPEHKLRIVNELRAHGYTTAVTGDGVNDAPALKAADVGIAMVNGSDVALEAAHLVLVDKFDSIIDGVRLGRLVFQNLQKVIGYLLPAGSWSEIWPVLLNVFFGVPLPLSSFLMIIICVFTDLFLSLSLIMEKEEFDLLSLPPRIRQHDHLINIKIYAQSYLFIGVMETTCAHAMYFLYYWRHAKIPISALFFAFENYTDGFYGYTQDELTAFNTTGQSVYFITLVLLQWGNILSIRNKKLSILQADPIRAKRRNPWLLLSMAISLGIAIFVTQQSGIQKLFGTASAPLEFWFLPLPLALGILVMDELRKLCVRTWPRGLIAKIAW